MGTHRITNKTAISRRREKSRRVEKGKGCALYSRERWNCSRIIVASQRTRHWQALVPLQIRQAVASDKGVPTAQSQLPERTRIRGQVAETAKERICQDIADDLDDWTLLINGNKDGLKVELHSIFRGAWPERDEKYRHTHLNRMWLFKYRISVILLKFEIRVADKESSTKLPFVEIGRRGKCTSKWWFQQK